MALAVGLACFLFFRTAPMPQSRPINAVASTTFGVLLVHANSDAMRKLLWGDLLDVPGAYALPLPLLMLHAVASTFGVFTICSLLDWLRYRFVESRYMVWYDVNEGKIASICSRAMHMSGLCCIASCKREAPMGERDPI